MAGPGHFTSAAIRWCGRRAATVAEATDDNTRRLIETCSAEFFAARTGAGAADCDPIFIVGLPRSGSTLLEQILASHPDVDGTQELHDIPRIVSELQGQGPNAAVRAIRTCWRAWTRFCSNASGAATSTRRASIGADGRVSSTRCRTTSGTSA